MRPRTFSPLALAAAEMLDAAASLGVNKPAMSPPSAMMHAPVSVAMSTIAATPHFSCANHSASASVSRPSASVLLTSTVLPAALVRMSPGRRP